MAKGRKGKSYGYGEGGIYPDSERQGHFVAKYRGKKRRAATFEAAKAAYQALKDESTGGLQATAHTVTLEQFANIWWEQAVVPKIATGKIAPKTVLDYRGTLERHVLPQYGQMKLKAFDAPLIIRVYYEVKANVSEAMASRVLTKLNNVFDAARRWKYRTDNPVADARKDLSSYATPEQRALTARERQQLLVAAQGHDWEIGYLLMVILGLRIGEVCGAQKTDVDFGANTITIQRQAQDITGPARLRAATKTRAGMRVLPLPPYLRARLWERCHEADERIYLVANTRGGLLAPNGFQRHFRGGVTNRDVQTGLPRKTITGMRQKAGLPDDVTLHVLRHTCATGLKELGVSEEVRADILGHGKKTITQTYSHRVLAPMREALTRWEEEVFGRVARQYGT